MVPWPQAAQGHTSTLHLEPPLKNGIFVESSLWDWLVVAVILHQGWISWTTSNTVLRAHLSIYKVACHGTFKVANLPDIYTKTKDNSFIDLHMELYYVWLCCYDNCYDKYWNFLLIMTTRPLPRTYHRPQEGALLVKCVLYYLGATYFIFTCCFLHLMFFVLIMTNNWYNISLACSVSTSSSHW